VRTLITTDVTALSTQKYVPESRAYCSENFRIISTDLSEGSTALQQLELRNINSKKIMSL